MPFNIDFTDKVIVVTGAGGVICAKISQEFAKKGAKVALLDINEEAAQNNANQINEDGGIAIAYKANVLDKENLEEVRKCVLRDLGKVDILINGAGGNNPKATTENEFHETYLTENSTSIFGLEKNSIELVFNLNFLGTLLPIQVFAKDMIGRKGTNIINISSMNAYTPLTKIPAYSGAKAAVSNLTQWLAVHFSHVGIRCNAIAPGFLVTNQNRNLLFNGEIPTERAKKILRNTPMGRFGEADELVGATFFLASENLASFVNGVIIPIDGGFNAYSGV